MTDVDLGNMIKQTHILSLTKQMKIFPSIQDEQWGNPLGDKNKNKKRRLVVQLKETKFSKNNELKELY